MYKALSNLKFMGKLYIKGDDVDLEKKLGKQLIKEGVVEISEKTRAEAKAEKKKEAEERKENEEKTRADEEANKNDEEDSTKKHKDTSEDELTARTDEREIDHKDISTMEQAVEAPEKPDEARKEDK